MHRLRALLVLLFASALTYACGSPIMPPSPPLHIDDDAFNVCAALVIHTS